METGASAQRSSQDPAAASSSTNRGPRFSLTGGDWPAQAADTIVNTVEKVRDRTTGPIMTAARALVFGVFIGTVAITVVVLAIIGSIRLLDNALPSGVWLPYLLLGAAFTIGGALLFRRRNAPHRTSAGNNSNR